MLAGYWSGVPSTETQARATPKWMRGAWSRYAPVALASEHTRWFPLTPAMRRLGDALLPAHLASWADLAACQMFDRWATAGLSSLGADAVIACEISALHTFGAARKRGLTTILDAPSLHHVAQDRLHGTTDSPELHRRILSIKDREVAFADHILTVSLMARDSYLEAGVPSDRVHALSLGADLGLFRPTDPLDRISHSGDGRFRFVFCGAMIRRKGFDLLIRAFERVAAAVPTAELRIVGPQGDATSVVHRDAERISFAGAVPQERLADELRRSQCLVLPSRNDSYGMVVPEALASGVPVIVSEMVGAKELVSPGVNGWIVAVDDLEGLTARMMWCAQNAEALGALRAQCRGSAERATWPAYHRRLTELLRSILVSRKAA
jgi:glycosyltransferase involved in cell wall biosynthesis